MQRRDLVLALLACAGGTAYTPVQIQKATFLVTKQLPSLVEGPRFEFWPYDYGPFDPRVYDEASALAAAGEVTIRASGHWNWYSVTPAGTRRGEQLLASLPPDVRSYLEEVATWVRSQSFIGLVKSIRKAYPEMTITDNQEGMEYFDVLEAHTGDVARAKLENAPAIDPPKPPTV